MNRVFIIIIVSVLLSACGGGDNLSEEPASESSQVTQTEEPSAPAKKPKELPDLAVILGAEDIAESYSAVLPFTMNIQIISPKAKEAIRKQEILPDISLGSEDSPWWQGLGFEAEVDGNTAEIVCDVLPETTNTSLSFDETSYNTATAVFQPDPGWSHKTVTLFCKVEKDGKSYRSRPLTMDFSAPAPQKADVDLARFFLLLRTEDFEGARELAEEYVTAEPENSQGYSMLADMYEAQGDFESAIKAYRMQITYIDEEANHDAVQFILRRINQLQDKIR